MHIHKHIIILALIAIATSACSNRTKPSNAYTTTSPTSLTGKSTANSPSAKNIFSNLSELQYTPGAQGAYKVAPNDLIEINVFRVAELSGKTRVDQNGSISFPLIGSMRVAGLSQLQLEKKIANALAKDYLQDPQVSVFIQEQTSKEITVGGRVRNAGVFPIKSATTVSQAIAMAGGMTDLADARRVVLFRPTNNGQFRAYNLNLRAIRQGSMRDPYINGKDQIIVHESGTRLWLGRVLNVVRGFVSPLSLR
ncbi:MAG TPA: polysaccharide export protein [Thiotrichaceae bacterium]|nr:polysaccharide export protein [Thiotrichaceae bacterium]